MSEFALHGHDLFGEVVKPKASGPVAERFTLPPFTVLDARTGEWQERKRAWAARNASSGAGLGWRCRMQSAPTRLAARWHSYRRLRNDDTYCARSARTYG